MAGPFDLREIVASATYYDLVLAVIPTVFVLAVLVGHLLSIQPRVAIGVASAVAALALADALFVNPPLANG